MKIKKNILVCFFIGTLVFSCKRNHRAEDLDGAYSYFKTVNNDNVGNDTSLPGISKKGFFYFNNHVFSMTRTGFGTTNTSKYNYVIEGDTVYAYNWKTDKVPENLAYIFKIVEGTKGEVGLEDFVEEKSICELWGYTDLNSVQVIYWIENE